MYMIINFILIKHIHLILAIFSLANISLDLKLKLSRSSRRSIRSIEIPDKVVVKPDQFHVNSHVHSLVNGVNAIAASLARGT